MYALVQNGQVAQVGFPSSGTLSDGRSVSNYDLLPKSALLAEGWLPLVENKPTHDPTTQELQLTGYTIEAERVIANYETVVIVAIPTLDDRLTAVEDVLMDILI
jgi:hypothetical protein